MSVIEIVGILLMLVIQAALVILALQFIYDFRLGPDGVEFVLFRRWRLCEIRYSGIEECAIVSWRKLLSRPGWKGVWIHYVCNRPFGRFLLIGRKVGIFRYIVITPKDAEQFAAEVRSRIPAKRGTS